MEQFGSVNGTTHLNGRESIASPSSPARSAPHSRTSSLANPAAGEYAEDYAELAHHLMAGYSEAAFSDFTLHVNYADPSQGSNSFGLHAVIVSRSPLLRRELQLAFANQPRPPTIVLPISDPSITSNSFSLVVASLYSPTVLSHVSKDNCASVLSTARFLGLERLAQQAFEQCQLALEDLKTTDEIEHWVAYLERERARGAETSPASSSGTSFLVQNGSASSPVQSTLRQTLLNRLSSLSSDYQAFNSSNPSIAQRGQLQLIDVLKRLPFDWFKATIEDVNFKTPSEMDRFNFAKKVVAARKLHFQSLRQGREASPHRPPQSPLVDSRFDSRSNSIVSASSSSSSPVAPPPARAIAGSSSASSSILSSPLLPHHHAPSSSPSTFTTPPPVEFDEAVVLGFGSGGTSAVHVLRKARRPQLWKVGPSTNTGL